MSLEELLKDSKSTSSWKDQKKKLSRIIIGFLIVACSLIVIFFLFSSLTKDESVRELASVNEDEEINALKRLIVLKKETEALQEDIKKLKNQKAASVQSQPQRSRRPQRALAAANVSEVPQVVDFDPGDSFTVIETKKPGAYIPTGAVFRARLVTPIKTSVTRSFVIAETTHEFRMDSQRKIEKGSRVIGRARLDLILRGVVVEFDKLVTPKGIETNLEALGLSDNALPQIEGLYVSDSMQNYGAILAFGFLGGFASASRQMYPTIWGPTSENTLSNQTLGGLSASSFQLTEEILRDIRHRAVEYVVVPAGKDIFIALNRRYDVNQEGASR